MIPAVPPADLGLPDAARAGEAMVVPEGDGRNRRPALDLFISSEGLDSGEPCA